MHTLLYCFILISSVCVGFGVPVQPIWLTSPYIKTDSYDLIQDRAENYSDSSVTMTFSAPAFSGIPNLGYGLTHYQGNDSLDSIMFQITKVELTQTFFTVQAQIFGPTDISLLTVRYIAIDKSFPHSLNSFDNVPANYPNIPSAIVFAKNSNLGQYENEVNFTQQALGNGYTYNTFTFPLENNKIVLFLTSLGMKGTLQQAQDPPFNPIDLKVDAFPISQQFYKFRLNFGVQAQLSKIHFSMIIFDQANVSASYKYVFVYQKINVAYVANTNTFIPVPKQFFPNLMMGLADFSTDKTKSMISFNLDFVQSPANGWGIQFRQQTSIYDSISQYNVSLFYLKAWQCPSGTYLNTQSNLCESCDVDNCIGCLYLGYCKTCDAWNGYIIKEPDGQCSWVPPLCGDNYWYRTEQCDDGNLNDDDGCSQACQVQANYSCEWNPDTSYLNTICYYIGQISMKMLCIQKNDLANQIEILIQITPAQAKFWYDVNFVSLISLSNLNGLDSYQINRNSDGTVSMIITYNKSIHNQSLTLSFAPALSGKIGLSRIAPMHTTLMILPYDNEIAYFYQQYVYDLAMATYILINIITATALLAFVLGIYASKLIGVQMMEVLQISYLSLLTFSNLNPCFNALSTVWFVNGPNYFPISQTRKHLLDEETPQSIKGLYLYSQFLQNYNCTLLLILVPYMIALVSLILSRSSFVRDWERKQKLYMLSKKMVCEYGFCGLMFSGYILSVSFALQIVYGTRSIKNPVDVISIIQLIILSLLYIFYFVHIVKKPEHFGQFTAQLINSDIRQTSILPKLLARKRNQIQKEQHLQLEAYEKQKSKWYNVLMLLRFVGGSWMVFMYSNQIAMLLLLGVVGFPIFSLAFKRIYVRKWSNLRFLANCIINCAIQMMYIAYKLTSIEETNTKVIWFVLPLIVCILLLTCVVYNTFLMIYYLILDRNKKKQEEEEISKRKIQNQQQQFSNYFGKQLKKLAGNDHSYIARGFTSVHPQKFQQTSRNMNIDINQIRNQIKKDLASEQNENPLYADRSKNQIAKETLSGYSSI